MSYFIGQRPCCSSSVSVNVFGWKEMQTRDWVVIWNLASENRALWWHVKPEVLIEFGHIHESMHWQEKKERVRKQAHIFFSQKQSVLLHSMCIWSKLPPDKACTDVWVPMENPETSTTGVLSMQLKSSSHLRPTW